MKTVTHLLFRTLHRARYLLALVLSSLMFVNDSCAFKVTTEAQTLELVLKSPGLVETARIGRDYDTFDLAWAQLPSGGTGPSGPTQLVPLSTPGTNGLVYGTTLRLFGDYAAVLDCPIESVGGNTYCHARVRVVHLPPRRRGPFHTARARSSTTFSR